MNMETLLEEEIVEEFRQLTGTEVGTDEYRARVDGLTKLMDRAIEIEKIEVDKLDKAESRKLENDLKLLAMDDEKRARIVQNCITVAGILLPLFVTIWGTKKSFEFEKEGTITTIMGRGFISKLLHRK